MERLIRCTQCNKVIPQYHGYGDFGEFSTLPGVEWSSEDLDQQKDFFRNHRNHLLEEILIDPETIFSDRPSYEPSKVTHMEASNGKDRFLIRRNKAGLSRPAFYEIIPEGVLVGDDSSADREKRLRKQKR
jgi:hypothetical protein